jgi:methyl-accepting chemotaxis protein
MIASLNTLAEHTKEIKQITNAITDISSQTNLLAIDATASQQQNAVRRIADQAMEVNALALQLFT